MVAVVHDEIAQFISLKVGAVLGVTLMDLEIVVGEHEGSVRAQDGANIPVSGRDIAQDATVATTSWLDSSHVMGRLPVDTRS